MPGKRPPYGVLRESVWKHLIDRLIANLCTELLVPEKEVIYLSGMLSST
jgi:hypothetical protein